MLCVSCRLKSNTPQWVFFTFFNLYKWYEIAQRITFDITLYFIKKCKFAKLIQWSLQRHTADTMKSVLAFLLTK